MMSPITAESVLRQLRQLSPRERLRVVAQVLPELEHDWPTNPDDPATANFLAEFDSWEVASDEALLQFEAALR